MPSKPDPKRKDVKPKASSQAKVKRQVTKSAGRTAKVPPTKASSKTKVVNKSSTKVTEVRKATSSVKIKSVNKSATKVSETRKAATSGGSKDSVFRPMIAQLENSDEDKSEGANATTDATDRVEEVQPQQEEIQAETQEIPRGTSPTTIGDGRTTKTNQSGQAGSSLSAEERALLLHYKISAQSTPEADPMAFLKARGYSIKRELGKGGFATVHEARDPDGRKVAVKIFDLTKKEQSYWVEKCLRLELFVSSKLRHPNIIFTYDVFKTRRNAFIVMQLAARGTMQADLDERQLPYPEAEARKYFGGVIDGLEYMHHQNVAHRDLKLDNFLLADNGKPMIADFGFAALGSRQTEVILTVINRRTPCGTDGYMAPELFIKTGVVKRGHAYDAKAVDIFAMGVSLFEMLNKARPFPADQKVDTLQKITNQSYRYKVELSKEAKDLIAIMLAVTPQRRPTVEAVKKSEWVKPSVMNTLYNTLFG